MGPFKCNPLSTRPHCLSFHREPTNSLNLIGNIKAWFYWMLSNHETGRQWNMLWSIKLLLSNNPFNFHSKQAISSSKGSEEILTLINICSEVVCFTTIKGHNGLYMNTTLNFSITSMKQTCNFAMSIIYAVCLCQHIDGFDAYLKAISCTVLTDGNMP